MAQHHETGQAGEALALRYLEERGYRILETNWRHRRAEVDLICWDGEILVFVEVKTRSSQLFGAPEAAVSQRKEELLIDAAAHYMEQIQHEWEIRFDIIAIVLRPDKSAEIKHFKDAFYA